MSGIVVARLPKAGPQNVINFKALPPVGVNVSYSGSEGVHLEDQFGESAYRKLEYPSVSFSESPGFSGEQKCTMIFGTRLMSPATFAFDYDSASYVRPRSGDFGKLTVKVVVWTGAFSFEWQDREIDLKWKKEQIGFQSEVVCRGTLDLAIRFRGYLTAFYDSEEGGNGGQWSYPSGQWTDWYQVRVKDAYTKSTWPGFFAQGPGPL